MGTTRRLLSICKLLPGHARQARLVAVVIRAAGALIQRASSPTTRRLAHRASRGRTAGPCWTNWAEHPRGRCKIQRFWMLLLRLFLPVCNKASHNHLLKQINYLLLFIDWKIYTLQNHDDLIRCYSFVASYWWSIFMVWHKILQWKKFLTEGGEICS